MLFSYAPSVSSISFFLFLCSRAPRDLHSFPTRRSSDLRLVDGVGGLAPGLLSAPAQVPGEGLQLRALARGEDRKSTRLNSSHLGISYAVFCLKKKNTKRNSARSCESVEGDTTLGTE